MHIHAGLSSAFHGGNFSQTESENQQYLIFSMLYHAVYAKILPQATFAFGS